MKILTAIKTIIRFIIKVNDFLILLTAYLLMHGIVKLTGFRFFPSFLTNIILPPADKVYSFIVGLNQKNETTINRVGLIELSIKNMRFKATRTLITIGGMAIGISAIVFLVSLGYGVEKLVTSRVARLDELKQTDIQPQPGSNMKLNDKVLANFKDIKDVNKVLPLIALVGKVNYKNSISDMAVYGVTSEYLKQSAIKPVSGKIFASDSLSVKSSYSADPEDIDNSQAQKGQVAGTSSVRYSKYLGLIANIEFELNPEAWLTVREKPATNSKILGYTKRAEGVSTGREVWGLAYKGSENGNVAKDQEGNDLGKWINSKFFIWENKEGKYEKLLNADNIQVQQEGYIAEVEVTITATEIQKEVIAGDVLGTSTSIEEDEEQNTPKVLAVTITPQSTTSNIVEVDDKWVILKDEEDQTKKKENIKTVKLANNSVKEAVVNRAMLKILGLSEADALGKEFETSFIVTSTLLDNADLSLKSEPAKYKIIGVVPQDTTPFFYVPFIDLRQLGITNYSEVKLVSANKESLKSIRQSVEASGFGTTSVVDTVEQIGLLFNSVRKVLALVGAVALGVAALGMFNTLTVSLMERTREIGLMKAMGMKSHEVQELFLTESMIMGVFGGFLGLFIGWLAGKGFSLILSSVSVFNGLGIVDVSYIPPVFILLIMILSVTVGVLTGIYPARRATRISALNALRYE